MKITKWCVVAFHRYEWVIMSYHIFESFAVAEAQSLKSEMSRRGMPNMKIEVWSRNRVEESGLKRLEELKPDIKVVE